MRIRFSYLVAVALAVGVSYYMLTGKTVIGGQPGADTKTITKRQSETAENLFAVQVELHQARDRASQLEVRGRTQADDQVGKTDTRCSIAGGDRSSQPDFRRGPP